MTFRKCCEDIANISKKSQSKESKESKDTDSCEPTVCIKAFLRLHFEDTIPLMHP